MLLSQSVSDASMALPCSTAPKSRRLGWLPRSGCSSANDLPSWNGRAWLHSIPDQHVWRPVRSALHSVHDVGHVCGSVVGESGEASGGWDRVRNGKVCWCTAPVGEMAYLKRFAKPICRVFHAANACISGNALSQFIIAIVVQKRCERLQFPLRSVILFSLVTVPNKRRNRRSSFAAVN